MVINDINLEPTEDGVNFEVSGKLSNRDLLIGLFIVLAALGLFELIRN